MSKAATTAPISIHLALAATMRDMGVIAKERRNTAQCFNFRGIDDVYNTLHPIFSAHGLVCIPSVKSIKSECAGKNAKGNNVYWTHVEMGYKILATDGSFVEGCIVGEGMDHGDKSTAKALSVAHKYFLLQLFLIPTEDLIDADAYDPTVMPRERLQELREGKGVAQTEEELLAFRIGECRRSADATGDDEVTDAEKARLRADADTLEKELATLLASKAKTPEPEASKNEATAEAPVPAKRGRGKAAEKKANPEQPELPEKTPEPTPKTDAQALAESGWQARKIVHVAMSKYKGRTVGEIEPKDIASLKTGWIDKYETKLREDPDKALEVDAILAAFKHHFPN